MCAAPCRETITSAAVPCHRVEVGWCSPPSAASDSTESSSVTTPSVSPRYQWSEQELSPMGTFTVKNELLVYFSYFSSQVSKLPRILCWAHQLCFSADSSRLFAAGARSSVHVFSLSQSECKHIHTLRPKSGQFTHTHSLSLPPSVPRPPSHQRPERTRVISAHRDTGDVDPLLPPVVMLCH